MKKLLLLLMIVPLLFTTCKKEDDTPLNLSIGDFHQGGIIFWLDGTNDHGLVCDIQDLGSGSNIEWGCYGIDISGANETGIGTGDQNTIDIEVDCTTSNIAADLCANSSAQGYTDWFLPSKDEINQMYINKDNIDNTSISNGGIEYSSSIYWSSSESDNNFGYNPENYAHAQDFSNGATYRLTKNSTNISVRAVRSF